MKSIAVLLLALTASIRAITPEEVVAKYGLENPSYNLEELDLSPCTMVEESTVYFYRGETDTLDSTAGWWSIMTTKGSMRKTTFAYRGLKNGFSEKVRTHFIIEGPETLSVTKHLYNKQGLLIREDGTSKTLRSTSTEYTYDLHGRLVRSHGKNYEGETFWDYRYTHDDRGRAVCKKFGQYPTWVDSLRYDDNDSIIVELTTHDSTELVPHVVWFRDSAGRQVKRIEYAWLRDRLPVAVHHWQYGSGGRVSRHFAFSDPTLGTYKDASSFVPCAYTIFEYDSLGRLRRKITRGRPYDE